MGLELRGDMVLTDGEYIELTKLLPDGKHGARVLVAMKLGHTDGLQPMDVFSALDIETRLAAAGPNARAANVIINTGLDRLKAAFPGEVPDV